MFSVRIATSKSCTWWRLPFVWHAPSAIWHVCCGQCTCTWFLLCTLTGSFCRLTLYGLSLPVRTRNALQNELTMAPLQCWVHVHICLMLFLETILWQAILPADWQFADSSSFHREYLDNYLANGYGSVITCTMVDAKPAVLTLWQSILTRTTGVPVLSCNHLIKFL